MQYAAYNADRWRQSPRPPRQTRQWIPRVDAQLRELRARETCFQAMRDDKREPGEGHAGGQPADTEFAEDREERAGWKEGLAGPPFAPVRGVAATSAAQDKHNHSGR